jgi:DNA (cytosine-5)-methyltransferase 1
MSEGALNGLDLFSGIGGLSLALRPWVRTVAYCENERYAQAVLMSRMSSGELEVAPIWDDVRSLSGEVLPPIDIIFGGFPCQDISVAGAGAGLAGERSGLIEEVYRLSGELRPRFIFLENVPAITFRGLGSVVSRLAEMGYDSRWTVLSAGQLGAVHLRERWWLLAHANGDRLQARDQRYSGRLSDLPRFVTERRVAWASERTLEPRVARAGDGVPLWVNRIKGLGNAVVPLQARVAFQRLLGIEERQA